MCDRASTSIVGGLPLGPLGKSSHHAADAGGGGGGSSDDDDWRWRHTHIACHCLAFECDATSTARLLRGERLSVALRDPSARACGVLQATTHRQTGAHTYIHTYKHTYIHALISRSLTRPEPALFAKAVQERCESAYYVWLGQVGRRVCRESAHAFFSFLFRKEKQTSCAYFVVEHSHCFSSMSEQRASAWWLVIQRSPGVQ